VFCGRHLLDAKLRHASVDAADGAVETVARIVAQIRRRWPHVRILVRADSGVARDDLMAWCEENGVHFQLGLAKNERLVAMIADELAQAEAKSRRTGKPARYFKEFRWLTRKSWSRERRVIAKAEFTKDDANLRFVVTSFKRGRGRDGDYSPPFAQIRTCSFPAYGLHLGYPRHACRMCASERPRFIRF
jgi:hypothetical protein